jgi:hypothetical protein
MQVHCAYTLAAQQPGLLRFSAMISPHKHRIMPLQAHRVNATHLGTTRRGEKPTRSVGHVIHTACSSSSSSSSSRSSSRQPAREGKRRRNGGRERARRIATRSVASGERRGGVRNHSPVTSVTGANPETKKGSANRPRVLVETQGATVNSAAYLLVQFIRTLPHIPNALIYIYT